MDRINIRIMKGREELARAIGDVERTLTEALESAVNVVKFKVMDLTPRWRGGLVQGIKTEVKGREGRVYGEGVVMKVHEYNGSWSKLPPVKKLQSWFVGKVGLSEVEAKGAAWGLAKRILKSGLTLPNKEKRGQMFQRTYAVIERTQLHWHAFMAKMRQLERRGA